MAALHQQYGALLELVRKLIGVVPNCDQYMEIWPPSFRTYNVLVPNFLNLPFALWGAGVPADLIGLSMYVASRNAGCAYCSAHSSAFALRRGATPAKIARALDGDDAGYKASERAAMKVARALASVPCNITEADRTDLRRHFPAAHVEWIVLGISMMGFLNKFMDAVGVELEGDTVNEVGALLGPSGWKPGKHQGSEPPRGKPGLPRADTFLSKLSVIPLIPSALSHDRQWTAGVPGEWPSVGAYLREHTGSDFKVLSRLSHERAIRAIAVILRDNLDAGTSLVGVPLKCEAGIVYSTVVENRALAAEVARLAARNRVSSEQVDAVTKFARGDASPPPAADSKARAALMLAKAASPSPAVIDDAIVSACRSAELPAAAVVELVTWISVLQMLHRLSSYYS